VYFEQSFEERDGGGLVLRGDVELRSLDDSDQEGSFDAKLAAFALADVVEHVAARLHDSINGCAALLERGKFEHGFRTDAQGGRALAQLHRAVTAGAQGSGRLEHAAGAHGAFRPAHGHEHLALETDHEDVARVGRERNGRHQ